VRFSEHFWGYKFGHNKSKFSQHLLENRHSIGSMENVMKVLYTTNKGKLLDDMERFYVYKEIYFNNQINDKNSAKSNFIFDTIVRECSNRAHTP
jgi:hypothetical protein